MRRSAPPLGAWCAADPGPTHPEVGPGSAAQREGRCAASGTHDRSARLPLFWHCGCCHFSSRTTAEALLRANEPSTVLPENWASIGSGNADSQRKVRRSREGGHLRRFPRDSGCVLAHPASRRAASYLPLRAVWAICAWALRGCARSPDPFSAPDEKRTSYKEFST